MPTLLTLRLTELETPPYPTHLHAAACRLLEPSDADHTAQRKPFTVGAPDRRGRDRDLAAGGLVRFLTPTYFNGRDVPLPDPVLVMRSLAQRWNVFAPTGLAIDDTLSKALLSAVLLTDAAVNTVRVQVGRDAWQTGFIGDAELALTHTAAPEVGAVFAALLRFATAAGSGAQTTYGFGEVRPEPLGRPSQPRRTNPGPPAATPADPPLATV